MAEDGGDERRHRLRLLREGRVRARTLGKKDEPDIELTALDEQRLSERPRVRSDCKGGARPCPWVGCKHHLYSDMNAETGSLKVNFPNLEVGEMEETCSLDVADRGGVTLEEVGEILNLTRERVRQIEVRGLMKLRSNGGELDPKR